jgi:tetratricopeptide (TPR) repeat protein
MQAGKKDADVFLDRARANIFLGNDAAAMKDLNEAISKDGSNPIAYYNRGYLRELQEKWKEAITDYRMVVSLDPEDDRAYYAMANSLVSLGQITAALDPIDKAIELDNGKASYYKVKGNITYRLNRNEEACGLWEKAVSLGDNKSNFYLDQYCK